ncbi:MAG: class I SAM-dependent methyltransferase [Vulcanimicrobiaceae bacterium]
MRRIVARELMDEPDVDPRDLAENFDDIERANRLFGGTRPVLDAVFAQPATRLLDVGCGSADIPRALLREARARERPLAIVGLDYSDTVLRIARDRTGHEPALAFVRGEGTALPFADASFDLATCTLALHHFEPAAAVDLLRELRRVSALTPIVCDLVRSRVAYAATTLFARCVAKNRLTKHDGPLSVRRAYTPNEAFDLAARAGWRRPLVTRTPYFRMVLVDRG